MVGRKATWARGPRHSAKEEGPHHGTTKAEEETDEEEVRWDRSEDADGGQVPEGHEG